MDGILMHDARCGWLTWWVGDDFRADKFNLGTMMYLRGRVLGGVHDIQCGEYKNRVIMP